MLGALSQAPISVPAAWEGLSPNQEIVSLPGLVAFLERQLSDFRLFCRYKTLSRFSRDLANRAMRNALRVLDQLSIVTRPTPWPSLARTCSAAERKLSTLTHDLRRLSASGEEPSQSSDCAPVWDAGRRELRFRGELCKRYKQPAPHQERILNAFAEENWPSKITDPLPGKEGDDVLSPPKRLNDAIRGLNRNLRHIRFCADGTSEGVYWDKVTIALRKVSKSARKKRPSR
jgi:hypothetical protein